MLVEGWERGKPAAFDITVTSPLCPVFLGEASQVAGAAALAAETRKHIANDIKCQELDWACVPIAVETYGNWGQDAKQTFSRLAPHLATDSSQPKSKLKLSVASMDTKYNPDEGHCKGHSSQSFWANRTAYLSTYIHVLKYSM